MKKTIIIRVLSALLLIVLVLLPSCSSDLSPSKKSYDKLDTNKTTAENLSQSADLASLAKKNAEHKYSYKLTYKNADTPITQGIENTLNFSNRGTENERIHRKNVLTEYTGGISTDSTSENYYYLGGYIHAECYSSNFKAPSTPDGFLAYSNGSDIAADPQFLSVSNFNDTKVYYCKDGTVEILCTSPKDLLKSAIFSFIGFDKETEKKYIYTASDVILTVFIDKDGAVTKKALTFTVDYYWQYAPDKKGKFDGNFTYTMKPTQGTNVEIPPVTANYTLISDINLLTSVVNGYSTLATYKNIDAEYTHKIVLSDTLTSHLYDVSVHFTEKLNGDKYYYGSVDTKRVYNSAVDINTTSGIFIDDSGYHSRTYDIKNEALGTPTDDATPDQTANEVRSMVIDTLSTEALYKSDITGFSVMSDGSDEIVFRMSLTGEATRYYAAYLMSVVAGSEDGAQTDLTGRYLRVNLNAIYITVRKSDGAIVKQVGRYEALLDSSILITSDYEMTVNSTSDDFNILTETDWRNMVNEIVAENNQEQE